MRAFLLFFTFLFSTVAWSCPTGMVNIWTQSRGYACVPRYPSSVNDCVVCQPNYTAANPYNPSWFQNFPSAIYQPQPMPWWAYQGNMYYPNLHYPGAWSYLGVDQNYYPGQGQVHALKPNVYIESIHHDKKFSFTFASKEKLSFLATTPGLEPDNSWKGRIVGNDKFEVAGINYDYLFYDIRLPKEKMQFAKGLCAVREETVNWMLKDLKEMNYPAIALQDFEQHWRVKIPDYPFFCIYPQYTEQLEEALPVTISLPQSEFVRSLYILVAHKTEPDPDLPQSIPLPSEDPESIRPKTHIRRENSFKEWGVAFLSE